MNIDIDAYRGRIGCFFIKFSANHKKNLTPVSAGITFEQFLCKINVLVLVLQIFSTFLVSMVILVLLLAFFSLYVAHVCFPDVSIFITTHSKFLSVTLAKNRNKICMICLGVLFVWIDTLLILSGDIEKNPGPSKIKNNLNFGFWNVDSLLSKEGARIPRIECLDAIHNFDLFGVCESYLNDAVELNDLNMHGFCSPPFRADCPSANEHKKGGVCLYYKDYLPIKNRPDLTKLKETIVCEIKLKNKKIYYILSYRSPSQTLAADIESYCFELQATLNKINSEGASTVIITGDFNAKSKSFWEHEPSENLAGKKMTKFMLDNCLEELVNSPTHFRNSATCIDLIFTNQPTHFVSTSVLPSPILACHHSIIHGTLNFSVPCPPPYKRKLWSYNRADNAAIREKLTIIDWNVLFANKNVNEMTEIFNSKVIAIMDKHIPNKNVIINDKDAPWITKHIKNKVKRKLKLYKKWKETSNIADKKKFKEIQAEIFKLVNEAKLAHHQKVCDQLNRPENEHIFWSTIKRLTNNKKMANIPPLEEGTNIISDFSEKTKIFNEYFSLQCQPFNYEVPLPAFVPKTDAKIENVEISTTQIVNLIHKLNPKKANGPDDISANMLKICPTEVAIPLKLIFEKCLADKTFPDAWKCANVQPVHKKDGRQLKTNYRPISLLPITSKIFEKILFDATYHFLNSNALISKDQSGFRPNDSTINQLLSITNEIYENYDNYCETRALFLDISKAFDKVWHKGLIFKLKSNGVCGNLLDLYENFLLNRKQRVVLNGQSSEYANLYSGVPQGSVLGPLLFLIYINDLTENISSQMKLFADDSSLFVKVNDVDTTQRILENDLKTIASWAHQWKMKFNPDVTKAAIEVIFSWKKNKPVHPPLLFNNIPVSRESHTKHLGLILDDRLTFKKHVEDKVKTANKGLGLLMYLKKYANRHVLEKMYKMYIRPHLDYGDVIYHGQTNYTCDILESVQYRAGLIVSGCWKGTSRIKLYNELGWESLYYRRHMRRLSLYYKILNGQTPHYLLDCINEIPVTSTNRYLMSFFPYCKAYWNNLEIDIKESPSIYIFKKKLMKVFRPLNKLVPKCDDKKLLSAFTRLRVGHSDLRDDRFRHNFNCSSPLCSCDTGYETVEHYLLLCPRYVLYRSQLFLELLALTRFSIIHQPNVVWVNILLYGDPELKIETNLKILDATLSYIKRTKRFLRIEAYGNQQ